MNFVGWTTVTRQIIHSTSESKGEGALLVTVEAVGVSDVVLLPGGLTDAGGKSAQIQRLLYLHELMLSVVDDGARRTAVHSHRHVLTRRYQLYHVPRS